MEKPSLLPPELRVIKRMLFLGNILASEFTCWDSGQAYLLVKTHPEGIVFRLKEDERRDFVSLDVALKDDFTFSQVTNDILQKALRISEDIYEAWVLVSQVRDGKLGLKRRLFGEVVTPETGDLTLQLRIELTMRTELR